MSEPVRILNLFTIMDRGGAETMVMNYYRNIDRSKVQFDFMVHREERGAYDDDIESLGGRIYRMRPIYPRNFIAYDRDLERFFDEHTEYRVIHSHMSELGYFAFRQAKKHGVGCTVCHAHNAPHFKSETALERAKDLMRSYFKRSIRKYTDHMFICGYDAGDWLFGKRNRKNFVMMNNAIDAARFNWDAVRAQKLRHDSALENSFVIVHVGRFNAQKNHTFLLDIFKSILSYRRDAVLLLVGTGELEDRIKKKAEMLGIDDRIRFMGTRSDVNDILLLSDVFVFPSLYEGLPVTLVEAQASGIRCVISDAVPGDCLITGNVDVVRLEASADEWAQRVCRYANGYERHNMYNVIKDRGFDIKENAKWLEDFYLNEHFK